MKNKEKVFIKTFDKSFWIYIGIFLFLVIVILFFPYLFSQYSFRGIDFTPVNGISNTIGIISPFIAILAAGLTFLAFWVQFKANEQQRYDIKKERFESTFYELLKFHKQNVDDLKIESLNQRELFQELYCELKFAYRLVKDSFESIAKTSEESTKDILNNYSLIKLINLSYQIFFYGQNYLLSISENQVELPKDVWREVRGEISDKLGEYNTDWVKGEYSLEVRKRTEGTRFSGGNKLSSYYKPFSGQSKLLGHYYRNLYQIVKYIDEQDNHFLSFEQKYNYIKTVRAQLSDHEQVILYYNSLSTLGYDWFAGQDKSLIVRYKLIKNAPLVLFWVLSPQKLFEKFNMKPKEIDEYFDPKNQLLEL